MSRTPAHAGRLRPSEQFVFAAVFALMAGFVVVITMSAARSPLSLFGGRTAAAGSQTVPAGTGGLQQPPACDELITRPASTRLDARLAAAMSTVLSEHPGRLAVGVVDATTGQQALCQPTQHFSDAGIVTADILAALLVRHGQSSTPATGQQATMAAEMMAGGSATATASMWRAIGAGNGLESANRLLKLTHTIPGPGDRWNQTTTTVADQLQLLIDVMSARSPLAGSARAYVLRLMTGHGLTSRWGVAAAGAGNVVQGGWLPERRLWVANSIGIVRHAGHLLLIVVLSSNSSSPAAGRSLASAAAVAAADTVISARS